MKYNLKNNLMALALASSCILSLGSTSDVLAGERLIKVQIGSDKAYTDGVESTIDAVPFQDANWNTMVPVRFIATALGIDDDNITYKWETKEVTIVNGNETLKFKVGENILTKTLANGSTETYTMQNNAVAEIIDGRTFVPLRTIGEIFGVEVDWEQDTKTVTLIDKIESEVNAGITKTNLNNNVSTGDSYYDSYGSVRNNYIYKENNNFITVTADYSESKLNIATYDLNFNKTTEKTLDFELSTFGGFYTNGINNYIVYAQSNLEENDNQEVYRVVKYDTSFNKISSLSIDGATSLTNTPFRAGSLSMSENNGELTVHTSKLRYVSEKDGVNHQSQMTFVIDTDTMEIKNTTDEYQKNHVSHSFNQFVKYDGDEHVLVDHGDAYPRAVVLHKSKDYSKDNSNDNYNGFFTIYSSSSSGSNGYQEVNLLDIPGEVGNNSTGVSVGGLEISDTNYLVPINKIDFNNSAKNERDVVLLTCDENLENVENITLQTYVGTDKTSSTPKIVDIDNNAYAVIWEEQNYQTREALSIKYVIVDGTGNPISSIQTVTDAKLSDVQPIYDGNNSIVWFTNSNAYSLKLTQYTSPTTTQTTTQATTQTTTQATTQTTTEAITQTTTQDLNSYTNTTNSTARQFEEEVVRLVNIERAKEGLAPLEIFEPAMDLARAKSQDMVDRNYFTHEDPVDGSYMFYDLMNYSDTAAENIASGQKTPAQVVDSWMNSAGHKANILNANFKNIGVGFVDYKWTQMFCSDVNSNANTTTTTNLYTTTMTEATTQTTTQRITQTTTQSNSSSSNSTVVKDASTHEAEFIELVNNAVIKKGYEPFKIVTNMSQQARAAANDTSYNINIIQGMPDISILTYTGTVSKNKPTAEELFNSFQYNLDNYIKNYDYLLVGFNNNNWYLCLIAEKNSSNPNITKVTTEATTQTTTQQTTTQTTTINAREYEEEVVRLVNIERAKIGVAPIEIFETAMDLARAKSQDMVDRKYFSHTDPDGYYMARELYNYFNTYSENIASGHKTPEEVVAGWMASTAGHRENILNSDFEYIGVGFANYKWTQMFAGDKK